MFIWKKNKTFCNSLCCRKRVKCNLNDSLVGCLKSNCNCFDGRQLGVSSTLYILEPFFFIKVAFFFILFTFKTVLFTCALQEELLEEMLLLSALVYFKSGCKVASILHMLWSLVGQKFVLKMDTCMLEAN